MAAIVTLKGGPGSGNWGHAGRPGKVGGSAAGSSKKYVIPKNKTLHHFTSKSNIKSILDKGLLPSSKALLGRAVYMTEDPNFENYGFKYGGNARVDVRVNVNNTKEFDGYEGFAKWVTETATGDNFDTIKAMKKEGYDSAVLWGENKKDNIFVVFDAKNIDVIGYDVYKQIVVTKGGPGSGNWGHAGRPGKVGGSLPSSVALSRTSGKTATARYIAAKRGSPTLALADMRNQDWKDIPGFKYERGVSQSKVVQLTHDGMAIVKSNEKYDTYKRDEAAYMLSDELGWGIVPPSVGMEVEPGQYRVAQKWVEGKRTGSEAWYDTDGKNDAFFKDTRDLDGESFSRMALLDVAIGNHDRHTGNFIIGKDGVVTAIDHNLAFKPWGEPSGRRHFDDVEEWWGDLRYRLFGQSYTDTLKVHSTDFNNMMDTVLSDKYSNYIRTNMKYGGDIHDGIVNRMYDIQQFLRGTDRWIED